MKHLSSKNKGKIKTLCNINIENPKIYVNVFWTDDDICHECSIEYLSNTNKYRNVCYVGIMVP